MSRSSDQFKTIMITGATGDLGSALAILYAAPGVTLALTGRNPNKLQQIEQHCRELGAEVNSEALDITDLAAIEQWVTEFDAMQPVDLIIANAGTTNSIGSNGESETWIDIQRVIDTNVYGTLASITPLVNSMRDRKSGHIAIVSSLAGYIGMPITPIYSASKAAIKVYGEALRGSLASSGVNVSVICPGFVKSSMSDQYPGATPFMISAEKAAQIIRRGLTKNKACIAFPFPLNLGTWLLTILPASISGKILNHMKLSASD
ncbi:MAG: SDR family NAD(P)-dependent oxidoreductase [Gammaproteobacteria bacterium]|nr:MAG: SDR family NAD(P)-dependent oxidoreductase [Gammaproteobacteria bacterium]